MVKLFDKPIDVNSFHLAGVIPSPSAAFDFDYQWPDHLTPILEGGISFIELAVYKCLYIGCDSIWIALERKGHRLTRDKLGEYALSKSKHLHVGKGAYRRKRVPIYYWHRANPNPKKYTTSSMIAKLIEKNNQFVEGLSNHLLPDRYFVSFPGSVYDPNQLRDYSEGESSIPKLLLQNSAGEGVREGALLDFVCEIRDHNNFDKMIYEANTGFVSQKDARESGKGLEEILYYYEENEDTERLTIDEHYEISNWQDYRDYMGSEFDVDMEFNLVSGDQIYRRKAYERHEN